MEDKVNSFLCKLKSLNFLSADVNKKLLVSGSGPGILYGLPKVHKTDFFSKFQFRPIFAAYNTPSFGLAKYLVPVLAPLTTNRYTVNNSYEFADRTSKVSNADQLVMASFDIESLFTNVPLRETINISLDNLFPNPTNIVAGLPLTHFWSFLELALLNSYFIFNNVCYQQVERLGMGLPLGPTLANIFMCFMEKDWLNECPTAFRPVFYQHYIDDTFLLFKHSSHVQLF